jgi:hypothetical protein
MTILRLYNLAVECNTQWANVQSQRAAGGSGAAGAACAGFMIACHLMWVLCGKHRGT